jgi:uroporphyrinogen III methyltransferase/synthase
MTMVYLVGAGPGDPDLLTLKGRDAIEKADAILFDHLANETLLNLAHPGVERIYVGKKKSDHAYSQQEIAGMMIERVRSGKTVVRLKGGDPYIFGRGGEEAEALADAGIPFEVVPGVTAPLGIAAYSGVPLTHREHTSAVTFLTGHEVDRIDWGRVGLSETLVIFMGLTTIAEIAARLIAAGRDPSTPAIVVRWGTRPEQETVAAPLNELASAVAAAQMKPPATVIVGEVVRLRDKLNWFERLPLFGQRIVVTRAEGQAGELASKLRALGANAIEFPVIEIRPPSDPGPLDRAIAGLSSYDWLLFTSVNGVRAFIERLDRSARDLRSLRARICAIGPATREAIERLHLRVDLMPSRYVGEGVVEAFAEHEIHGARILFPRAADARDVIPVELAKRGALVDVVEAYRTGIPAGTASTAPDILARKLDWITFTSSSTVTNFIAIAGRDSMAKAASIGPVTSATLRHHGLQPEVEADPHDTAALVEAIVRRVAETKAASR